jgi:hypothetical protein
MKLAAIVFVLFLLGLPFANAQKLGKCSNHKRTFDCTFYPMTVDSAVYENTVSTWGFGAEVMMGPPLAGTIVSVAQLHFKLPPNGTVLKVQGTLGAAAPFGNSFEVPQCIQPNGVLAFIWVDGRTVASMALHFDAVVNGAGKDRDLFFSYDIPIPYTEGDGLIEIQSNPMGCWSDVGLEGLMQIG